MNKLGLSPAGCRRWWEEPRPGQGMWIICWAGGKQLSGLSWGAGNRPGPNRSSEQGVLTGAREEERPSYTTVLSLQLMSTIGNPLDLIWSQQEVEVTTSLAKVCRADLWRILCQKDFGSSIPKSYLLNFPRWMLGLFSTGFLYLFSSSHWSGNN